jgi:hypothetical protein
MIIAGKSEDFVETLVSIITIFFMYFDSLTLYKRCAVEDKSNCVACPWFVFN